MDVCVISAEPETCLHFTRSDQLLLDSGGQYTDGTTDVTRTVHWGRATPTQVGGSDWSGLV